MRETQDLLQETEQSLFESSSYALRDLEMKHKMAFDHIEKQLVSLTKQLEYKVCMIVALCLAPHVLPGLCQEGTARSERMPGEESL